MLKSGNLVNFISSIKLRKILQIVHLSMSALISFWHLFVFHAQMNSTPTETEAPMTSAEAHSIASAAVASTAIDVNDTFGDDVVFEPVNNARTLFEGIHR